MERRFRECELRNELANCARRLDDLGFTPGTAGNLSVRLEDGSILATPSGWSKAALTASSMVVVDQQGNLLRGDYPVTSEIGLHLAIYSERPDILAVVHAHPPIATGFACCGLGLEEPICCEIAMTLGSVPLAPYATTGTAELGESIRPLAPQHDAILLANHGAVSYGSSLRDATMKMEIVEHFARVLLTARQLGTPQQLTPSQLGELAVAKQAYLARVGTYSTRS
jgi:L-fuculose-phosphate aldolase